MAVNSTNIIQETLSRIKDLILNVNSIPKEREKNSWQKNGIIFNKEEEFQAFYFPVNIERKGRPLTCTASIFMNE